MGRHEDPRERRRAAQEDDPYEHLMDNIDTLLQDDEYEGPDSGRPPRRSAPDQWYDAYGDENDYNAGYDPGYGYPEQPRCPEFRAYNVDFEQPPRQKRRPRPQENHPEYYGGDAGAAHTSGQPRKKKARNDAPRSSAPRSAKRRRHPILKLLLGLLMGVMELVPYIGPVLAGIPAVLMALQSGWTQALWTLLVLWTVQQVEGSFLSPRLLSGATRLHPLTVLLAISAGGIFSGTLGMLLALPVVVSVRGAMRGLRR